MTENTWHDLVPNAAEFDSERERNLDFLASESEHRPVGLTLMQQMGAHGFGHKNAWMGVPIIRLPEDLILQQEIVWREKPDLIIEIGVARGGGLLFNASLQEISGLKPRVIGVDNKIYDHTHHSISNSRYRDHIQLIEGDSVSAEVMNQITKLTQDCNKALLILDSDHSSKHVLKELRNYVPAVPVNSIIMVCDTLIDEYPEGTYPNRTWSDGKGPQNAIEIFIQENESVERFMERETKALVLSEIRNGILRKTSN